MKKIGASLMVFLLIAGLTLVVGCGAADSGGEDNGGMMEETMEESGESMMEESGEESMEEDEGESMEEDEGESMEEGEGEGTEEG